MVSDIFEVDQMALLRSLGAGRGSQGFTINEGMNLLEWARTVTVAHELLGMALDGKAVVTGFSIDGEPLFTTPENGLPAVVDGMDARIPYSVQRVIDAGQRLLGAIGFAGEEGSQDAVVLDNCDAACALRLAIWDILGIEYG